MLVVQNSSFNYDVMALCAESAPSVLPELIVKPFAMNQDVRTLTECTSTWVDAIDAIRKHREIAGGPGVAVQSDGDEEAFSFLDEWQLLVEGTSNGA